MHEEWILALAGGGLIGIAATLLLVFNGRVAGISGIVAGLLSPVRSDILWRSLFVAGLLGGGLLALLFLDDPFANHAPRSTLLTVIAGILVGFGTRLGSGCTSGHGVCGVSRMSPRSLIATITFIVAGAATVPLAAYFLGVAN